MTLYADVQKKAQAELDSVVGHDRLPNLGDRDVLPYLGALINEVLRWSPVVPTSTFVPYASHGMSDVSWSDLPHVLTEEDEHDGFSVPKGTVVLVSNITINNLFCRTRYSPSVSHRRSMLGESSIVQLPFQPQYSSQTVTLFAIGAYCMIQKYTTTLWNSNRSVS